MKLALVIGSLRGGGAENMMTQMANYRAESGWQVALFTFDEPGVAPFYPLAEAVTYCPLGGMGEAENLRAAVGNNLRRIRSLRKALRQFAPEGVISFLDRTNITVLFAARRLGIPVIISERSDPQHLPAGALWERLRWLTYPWADAIVVQNSGIEAFFRQRLKNRLEIIPNAVRPPVFTAEPPEVTLPRPCVVAAGRLSEEKRFDLLIRAFARTRSDYPEWSLAVLGDGPERGKLLALREELKLEAHVHLPGRVSRPYDILRQADLFVLSSRTESFPVALCEAMSCGLPVISTDCPSGPRDIVQNDVNGLLVPNQDEKALGDALLSLMGDPARRQRLAQEATEVIERFSTDKIMKKWDTLLRETAAHRRQTNR